VVDLLNLLRELLVGIGRLVQLLPQRQIDVVDVQVLLLLLFDSQQECLRIIGAIVITTLLLERVLAAHPLHLARLALQTKLQLVALGLVLEHLLLQLGDELRLLLLTLLIVLELALVAGMVVVETATQLNDLLGEDAVLVDVGRGLVVVVAKCLKLADFVVLLKVVV